MGYRRNINAGGNTRARKTTGLSSVGGANRKGPETQHTEFYEIESGEVLDVIYNESHPAYRTPEDIGKARIRPHHSRWNVPEARLSWAKPMNPHYRDFPVRHEMVLYMEVLGHYYYFPFHVSIYTSVNHNAAPRTSIWGVEQESPSSRNNNYAQASAGASGKSGDTDIRLGEIMTPLDHIKPLVYHEGDVTIEGRFGHSVHWGYNPDNFAANIYIRAGQREDPPPGLIDRIEHEINKDWSSIYLTEDEIVGLIPSTLDSPIHQRSAKHPITVFDGAEIISNSDRIVVNARRKQSAEYAEQAIIKVTKGRYSLDTEDGVWTHTLNDHYCFSRNYMKHQTDDGYFQFAKRGIEERTFGPFYIEGKIRVVSNTLGTTERYSGVAHIVNAPILQLNVGGISMGAPIPAAPPIPGAAGIPAPGLGGIGPPGDEGHPHHEPFGGAGGAGPFTQPLATAQVNAGSFWGQFDEMHGSFGTSEWTGQSSTATVSDVKIKSDNTYIGSTSGSVIDTPFALLGKAGDPEFYEPLVLGNRWITMFKWIVSLLLMTGNPLVTPIVAPVVKMLLESLDDLVLSEVSHTKWKYDDPDPLTDPFIQLEKKINAILGN